MDYVEGRPLSDILSEEGVIEEDKVADYAIQLCDVLDYLHSQNPPDNIQRFEAGKYYVKT